MNTKNIFLLLVAVLGFALSGAGALESPDAKFINISTRGNVGSDSSQELIAGFVIEGSGSKRILVRGVGPYLVREEGLEEDALLADPYLMLVRHLEDGSVEIVEENDDWPWDDIRPTIVQFPVWGYGGQSFDAEITIVLEPGIYSAILSGKGGSGIALVEVYESID